MPAEPSESDRPIAAATPEVHAEVVTKSEITVTSPDLSAWSEADLQEFRHGLFYLQRNLDRMTQMPEELHKEAARAFNVANVHLGAAFGTLEREHQADLMRQGHDDT